MCRTVHALLQTVICGIQMLVRVFMTVILMIENLIRMILQTLYNFISFMLQMLSLVPICVVFLITSKLKCFMCGGGGPCPVNRGGTCDCLMSAVAIIILFLILRAIGLLDVIFYKIGYIKTPPVKPTPRRFVATPGDITECSRETEAGVGTDYDLNTIKSGEAIETSTRKMEIEKDKDVDLEKETDQKLETEQPDLATEKPDLEKETQDLEKEEKPDLVTEGTTDIVTEMIQETETELETEKKQDTTETQEYDASLTTVSTTDTEGFEDSMASNWTTVVYVLV